MSLERFRPLNELERFFKEYWLHHPLLNLECPCSLSNVEEVFCEVQEKCGESPDDCQRSSEYSPAQQAHEKCGKNQTGGIFLPGAAINQAESTADALPCPEPMKDGSLPDMDTAFLLHPRFMPAYRHAQDDYDLLCILGGGCTLFIGEQEISLTAGGLCFLPPGTEYALSVFSDECTAVHVLMTQNRFEKSFFGLLKGKEILTSFFRHALCSSDAPYLLFRREPEGGRNAQDSQTSPVSEYVRLAWIESQGSGCYQSRILHSLISVFFMALLQSRDYIPEFPGSWDLTNHRNIFRIIEHLQNHYEDITQDGLSRQFGYSTRQMTRLIKEYTGKTFTEIVQLQINGYYSRS